MRRIAVVLFLIVVGLSALVAWRLRRQEAELRGPPGGSGEIEGTVVDVASRLSARILDVHVAKGFPVKKGDLVATLDCAEPQAALNEALARLEVSRADAVGSAASVEAMRRSSEAAAAAREAAKAQAEALAAQRDAAKRQANRLEALANDVPAASRDAAAATAEGLARQVAAAEAQVAASAEQQRASAGNVRATGARAEAARLAVRVAEAAVARARLMVAECEIRAPRDAVVSELPREAGELVTPGAVLARLVDLSTVKATFYLPNAELAAVRTGAKARVVADAWPGVSFDGTVSTVAVEAEFTPRNIQTRTDRDRLVYPVEVVVPNPDGRLRPGMPVQVSIAPATPHPVADGSIP